jgi:hypothetical protein
MLATALFVLAAAAKRAAPSLAAPFSLLRFRSPDGGGVGSDFEVCLNASSCSPLEPDSLTIDCIRDASDCCNASGNLDALCPIVSLAVCVVARDSACFPVEASSLDRDCIAALGGCCAHSPQAGSELCETAEGICNGSYPLPGAQQIAQPGCDAYCAEAAAPPAWCLAAMPSATESSGLGTTTLVGIAVGAVAGIALIALILYCMLCRKTKEDRWNQIAV